MMQSSSHYSLHHHFTTQQHQQMKREKRKYRCRKRSPATIERAKIVRRDKANARERRRMNSLNDALEELRTLLPQHSDEPKMTKIETLRLAQQHIYHLVQLLMEGGDSCSSTPSSNSIANSLPPLHVHPSPTFFQYDYYSNHN